MRSLDLRLVVFVVVSSAIFSGIHLYLYRRWVRDVWTSRRSRQLAGATLSGLALLAILARPLFYVFGTAGTRPLALLTLCWMGLALCGAVVLGTIDLLGGIGSALRRLTQREPFSVARRRFISRSVAGSSALISVVANGYGASRALGPPEVTELPVRLPHLPPSLSGLTLVQLSDLHIGEVLQERAVDDWVQRCNALRPDALVITGDLVDGSVGRLGRYVARLQRLRARFGVFFVTGNHDYYSGADPWCSALEGLGFTVLRNRQVSIGDAGGWLDIAGVDDWGARRNGRGYDLDRALSGANPDRPRVLLAHQPANVEEVSRRGVGLQLSGHTHGGQAFPLTWLVGLAWPFPRGHYRIGETQLYVSRGTGFVGPPVRLDSPPEIVRVTLTS